MNYLKFITVVLSFFLCLTVVKAQDAGTVGFKRGQYSEAAQLYDTAASVEVDAEKKSSYYAAAKKSRTCAALLKEIQLLYSDAQELDTEEAYNNVKVKCESLLKYNSKDQIAQKILQECDIRLAALEDARLENEMWEQAKRENGRQLYEAYLSYYPSGAHVAEAKDALSVIDENELWAKACRAGTAEAYKQYLDSTKVGTYKSAAKENIGKIIDQEKWSKALTEKTEDSFKGYIEDTENNYKSHLKEARAHLSVAEAMTYAALPEKDPAMVVRKLEEAKGVIQLDSYATSVYLSNLEEMKYQDYVTTPSILKGKDFLKEFPSSKFYDNVSESIAEQYMLLGVYSSRESFALAKSYARSSELKRKIAEKEGEAKKYRDAQLKSKQESTKSTSSSASSASKSSYNTSASAGTYSKSSSASSHSANAASQSLYTSSSAASSTKTGKNRVWFTFGLDYEGLETYRSALPKVGLNFGAPSDFFNFYLGAKYQSVSMNLFESSELEYPRLYAEAVPVYVGMKFGIVKFGSVGGLYIAAEGAYSFPLDTYISYSNTPSDMDYLNEYVCEHYWDLSGKVGISVGWFELGFYYKYLMSPMFMDDIVLAYPGMEQYGVLSDFTTSHRLGLYVNIGLRLGKKK